LLSRGLVRHGETQAASGLDFWGNLTTAHVAMGKNEVQVGDHVELYHNDCTVVGERSSKRQCKKVATGHGEVTSTFDGDYSEVTFPEGTKFVEGDTVEKHQH
jgi:hypothetical protein